MHIRSQRTAELTELINVLVQEFLEIHQNLNDAYTGISKQELNIISIVGRSGGVIMREIAEQVRLAVSSVTPIVDKLVEKKLARRDRSEEDRRIVTVMLTEKGQKIYQMEVESYMRLSASILEALSEKEQEQFVGYFRKVATFLQKEESPTA
ncbi:MAG: MarR family winged helix-turn-helix transcriptional regulator [Candidatus Kapaibacteriota bacterium]|jgi:DNA-binding MarR family transcriptional regulator